MRYSVKLSYNGAPFCGWQRQPGAPSVQEELEKALGTLTGAPVTVTGAGRTDTAVNAIGYVASFEAREGLDTPDFCYKLNAILPAAICVLSVDAASPDFNARFDAKRREYCYFLHRKKDPFVEAFSYRCGYPELDFDAMNCAAQLLLGTHDFSCFEKTGSDNKTSICTVYEAGWHQYVPSHLAVLSVAAKSLNDSGLSNPSTPDSTYLESVTPTKPDTYVPRSKDGGYWYFRIAADRFLRNMVRAIVGTLIEVGRGKRSVESVAELIAGGTRSDAGESVPGHALFLSHIDY
ncbi:MAG: tRNA pseudouridine synthase A [Bacteroidales bacterium]|nr:tRNA pseudouridine synthase A [Bacteroidales bacterium]